MTEQFQPIPRTKEAIRDYIYAAVAIGAGVITSNTVIDAGFEAHISGIAMGFGIGWLIKSMISHHKRAVEQKQGKQP
jgi:membrane associated rhomboid family serine protease